MGGGLYDPLGATSDAVATRRRPSVVLVAAGIVTAAVALIGMAAVLRGGDERGEPRAVVTIERPPPVPPVAPTASPPASAQPAPPAVAASAASPAAGFRDADVEIQNGVRIIRMRSEPARPSAPAAAVQPPAPVPQQGTQVSPASGTK